MACVELVNTEPRSRRQSPGCETVRLQKQAVNGCRLAFQIVRLIPTLSRHVIRQVRNGMIALAPFLPHLGDFRFRGVPVR